MCYRTLHEKIKFKVEKNYIDWILAVWNHFVNNRISNSLKRIFNSVRLKTPFLYYYGFESCQGLLILSSEDVVQLALRTCILL
jgi:hypothetical protein